MVSLAQIVDRAINPRSGLMSALTTTRLPSRFQGSIQIFSVVHVIPTAFTKEPRRIVILAMQPKTNTTDSSVRIVAHATTPVAGAM